jgi:glycolate oxidase iron-sulfur subunit
VVPEKLVCCGTPQWSSGDREGARALSYQNLEAFHEAGVEVILTDCGSCGSALRKYGEVHQQGPRSLDFGAFSSKIQDVVSFLHQEGISAGKEATYQKITYHDSCHLAQGLKITVEPRQLLANLPGIDYREMNGAEQCCGGGGSFMLKYPETSQLILRRKLANIRATGAEKLVTSCPLCRFN